MKTINYRFDPNDNVYWVSLYNEPVEGKCPFCLGDGTFLRQSDGSLIPCHNCGGKGKVNIGYDASYKVFSGTVNTIRTHIQYDNNQIWYNVCDIENGWGHDLDDSRLYESIIEATKACEKLNKELGKAGSRGTYGTT